MRWPRDVPHRKVHVERLRAFRIFGRRGLFLLLFGIVWLSYGIALLSIDDQPPRFTMRNHPVPVLSWLDHQYSGIVWVLGGALGILAALFRTHRHGRDAAGFNALLFPPFVWVLGYTWSTFGYIITGVYGRPTAVTGCLVWLIATSAILVVAGWPDPDDPAFNRKREE